MATRDEIIQNELQFDPLGRDYASMTDEQARDSANAEDRTLEQGVWLSDAYQYLSHRNEQPADSPSGQPWPVLVMLQELAESGTVQTMARSESDQVAARNLWGFFAKATDAGGQLIYMDFSQAAIRLSWDAMVSAGVLDPVQRAELETLSNIPQSRAAEIGAPNWTTFEVQKNRP